MSIRLTPSELGTTTMPDTAPTEILTGKDYNNLLLGVTAPPKDHPHRARQVVYLWKHEWLGGWYWLFGSVTSAHTVSDFRKKFLTEPKNANKVFETSPISGKDWWTVLDLYAQAYKLKDAASVYRYGGHLSAGNDTTRCIRSATAAKELNNDCERVLTEAWHILSCIQWNVDEDEKVQRAIKLIGE